MAIQAPLTDNAARTIPRTSSKDRNSTGLGKQVSLSALGQNSLGQGKQSGESEKKTKKKDAKFKFLSSHVFDVVDNY